VASLIRGPLFHGGVDLKGKVQPTASKKSGAKYRRAVQFYVLIAMMSFLMLWFLYVLYGEWYDRVQWQYE